AAVLRSLLGSRVGPRSRRGADDLSWRREWDLNPRCPLLDTTVFETAPFGRSGIPPRSSVRVDLAATRRASGSASTRREEGPEQRAALVRAHPVDDLELVVEPRIRAEVVEAAERARLRVGGAERDQ